MGRPADTRPLDISREQITIVLELNEKEAILVNKLLATGYFGKSPKEVCQRCLDESLLEYARDIELSKLFSP